MNDNYYCPLGKNMGNGREIDFFNRYSFQGILPVYPFIAGVSFGEWWTPGMVSFPQKVFYS